MELKDSSTTSFDFQMESLGSRESIIAVPRAAGAKGDECRLWIISQVWRAAPGLMDAVALLQPLPLSC